MKISEDRAAEHEEAEGEQQPHARHDLARIRKREGDRRQHDAGGEILDAVADPEAALGRKQLEQDGAGDDGGERGQREQDAVQAVGPDRHAMPDDEADADNAEQQAEHLAPGQRLAEEHRGEGRREHRIGRDDQAAETGRDRLQPGIAEAEIERVVGDAEDREDRDLAPRRAAEAVAAEGRGAEDHDAGQRKARREQDQRRTIGDADLAGDECKAPEQAEQADFERQPIEAALRGGNGDGGRDGHGDVSFGP